MALLEVKDLHIGLQTQRGPAEAVRGIDFTLERGETLGIVGESGCGKSITVMSLMGLLPASAKVTGSIRFDGTELVGLGTQPPQPSWGRMLSEAQTLMFQAPLLAVFPGMAIALAVLGLNLLGDGLRDLMDPRLARKR